MAIYKGDNPLSQALKDDARGTAKALIGIMTKIGNIVVNETKNNFKRQGFMDRSVRRWKPRKKRDTGRAILVKSGTLRRSIKRTSTSAKRVTVASAGKAAVYAGVHNNGLRAGRGRGFKMPKRQFLGPSATTNKRIINLMRKTLKKGFK